MKVHTMSDSKNRALWHQNSIRSHYEIWTRKFNEEYFIQESYEV